jgi:hypothetical protein
VLLVRFFLYQPERAHVMAEAGTERHDAVTFALPVRSLKLSRLQRIIIFGNLQAKGK